MDSIEPSRLLKLILPAFRLANLSSRPSMPERSREPASMKWLPEDKDLLH